MSDKIGNMAPELIAAIVVAVIAAAASIGAAVIAARSAAQARTAESEAARLRALEERLAQRKYELYEPILTAFGTMMTPGRTDEGVKLAEAAMPPFLNFVTIWGSDEALRAFHRYRIASSAKPPTEIIMRLVADFLVASRRDLADDASTVTGVEVLGIRMNDLYQMPTFLEAFTLPFEELARKHKWSPPWEIAS